MRHWQVGQPSEPHLYPSSQEDGQEKAVVHRTGCLITSTTVSPTTVNTSQIPLHNWRHIFFFKRPQFRFLAIKVEKTWVKMCNQFIYASYNWFETLSLDDLKYYVWGNSVWHTRRFDAATGRTPVGPTLISCSTPRVTLDVLGTGQHFHHFCCWITNVSLALWQQLCVYIVNLNAPECDLWSILL